MCEYPDGSRQEPCGRGMARTHHLGPGGMHGCCHPPEGRVPSFLQPRLILLLLQKPAHGYELMERLAREDAEPVDPGLLYRTLRQLEEDGLVQSSWDTEGRGPARRHYEATPEGIDYLHAWAANIQQLRGRLDRFLQAYQNQFHEERG